MSRREGFLEPEQDELLCMVAEAARNVPRSQRQKFLVAQTMGGDILIHPGLPGDMEIYAGDVEILANQGLVALSHTSNNTLAFDVSPSGFRYYAELKRLSGSPVQRVEKTIRVHLDSAPFEQRFPKALRLWSEAEVKLWTPDADQQLTTIGHSCREAMQEFAAALVLEYAPSNVDPDPTHIVARTRQVLQVGMPVGRVRDFLDALLAYWGTVSDLVQRQEHGAQKEGEPLLLEDARRVVFQTALVMFEISRALPIRRAT